MCQHFFATSRFFRWGGSKYLLQLQVESLEAYHGRDELLLVTLDTLDGDDALGELVGVLLLGGLGFGGLLLGVLGSSFLGLDGQRGSRGF